MYSITLHLPAGPLYAGLVDLRAQLINTSGATVGSAISAGFVEVGSAGNYIWTYASMPDGHTGIITFYSNAAPSNILGIATINPAEVEPNAMADALLGRSVATVEDTASLNSLTEIILLLLKSRQTAIDTQTIYQTDGVTVFGTRTLETDPDALPIVGVE